MELPAPASQHAAAEGTGAVAEPIAMHAAP